MSNGLELMLDIQQDEYLPIWGETGERDIILFIQRLANLSQCVWAGVNVECGTQETKLC